MLEQDETTPCCLCGTLTKVIKPYPKDEQLCDDCVKEVQLQRDDKCQSI